jgi:hypothetical protein
MASGMDDMLDDYTQRMEAKRERAQRRAYLLAAKPVASRMASSKPKRS